MMINLVVQDNLQPIRLDKYVRLNYPGLTQGVIEKAIRTKAIKLNGIKTSSNQRVHSGDNINILDSLIAALKISEPIHGNTTMIFSESVKTLANKIFETYLIEENDQFLVLNKPKSLPTQGGTKISLSIDHSLHYINQQMSAENNNNKTNFLKLVHRLDKDTTGILLIAKGLANAQKLTEGFREKQISKKYLAILDGILDKPINSVETIVTDGEEDLEAHSQSKLQITEYKILAFNLEENLTLCQFKAITGRKHQLRYHAHSLGTPILGDQKFQRTTSNYNKSLHQNSNLYLHAHQIILEPTIFGNKLEYVADIPFHFQKLISKFFEKVQIAFD